MAGNILELRDDNFEEAVLKSDKPVVVDFWATWCMPCKMLAPIVEEIANECKGKYKIAKLNIDDAMDVATNLSVMNIPTLIFFSSGKEVARIVGAVSKRDVLKKIEEAFV
ncbi:MAG: thioredoxin [Candidatus Omnitrophica bacterium CG1_02_40_15]|nr:MAG: thioredoxin [Candidatus Omnitrophica bacterium CG1_02_40_15]